VTNHESDELLRQVIDELGEIRKVLGERLPQPVKPDLAQGKAEVVVTGEGSLPSPVAAKTSAKKAAAKPH
jgi:hypothetical protein